MTTIQYMIFLLYNFKISRRILILIIGTLIIYYLTNDKTISALNKIVSGRLITARNRNYLLKNTFNISPNVHIVDLTATTKTKFQCIKTKKLLHNLSTHMCLHQTKRDRYISGAFQDSTSIWEEEQVTHMLQLLIRHPHLHFIDIGANIGTYTMFVAALGRFVLAIDCFAPNLDRLRRAIQLANVFDRVVLVQNAIFTHSGEYLRLSIDIKNIGGQGIYLSRNHSNKHRTRNNLSTTNPYIVKTITFDEVLPILVARGIRGALMKIDIEGSESFVVQNGSHVFDTLDIPFIQMEWKMVRRYADRVKVILDFFDKRNYDSITSLCQLLDPREYTSWPDEIYWLKRNVSNFC
jgi:FkbM family methyltransferase